MFARADEGQLLLGQLKESLQASRYSASSVVAGLAVSVGGTLVAFLLFLVLRPRIKGLYSPNASRRLALFEFPGTSLFCWARPVAKTTEQELVDIVGLDATVLLIFVKTMRNLFIVVAFLGCGVGIPVNVIFNLRSRWSENLSKSDAFIMMTPALLSGIPMAAHVALGWCINAVVMFFLYVSFKKVLRLRLEFFQSPDHYRRLVHRTLLVTGLSKGLRSNRGLQSVSHGLRSSVTPTSCTIGTSVKRLESMLDNHKQCVRRLEKYMLAYQRKQQKDGTAAERPLCRIKGSEVDAIEYWQNNCTRLANDIAQERIEARLEKDPLSYGFISYPYQNDAHSIAQDWHGTSYKGIRSQLAPEPEDIIWANIDLSSVERASKQLWINIFFAFMMLVWIVPNAFIGCFLTNLSRLGALWPRFSYLMDRNPIGFAILQGVLAPMVTSLIFMILPWIMRKLSRWQGKITKNQREMEVIRKLFAFFFLINFFVFTLMGVVWDIVSQTLNLTQEYKHMTFAAIWKELKVGERLSTAIINVSSFWVMYLLRANIGLLLDLLQVLSLITRGCYYAFTRPSPRERIELSQPQPAMYAVQYIWMLFYMTIAMGFTTIQPITLLVMAFYFTIAVPLKKYQIMYMFYTKYESYGAYWPLLNNTVIFATMFGNLMLLCVVWVQSGWKMAMGVIPLPVTLIIFKIVSYRMFDSKFYFYVSDAKELPDSRKDTSSEIEEFFGNPALTKHLDEPILSIDQPYAQYLIESEDKRIKEQGLRNSCIGGGSETSHPEWGPTYADNSLASSHSQLSLYEDDEALPVEVPSEYPPQYRVVESSTQLPYPEHDFFSRSHTSLHSDLDTGYAPDNDAEHLMKYY